MSNTHRFENYTSLEITVRRNDGTFVTFPSMGVASVTEQQHIVGDLDGFEVRKTTYKEIVGLPPQSEDRSVTYIVSMVVAQADAKLANPRNDLLSTDSGRSCIRGPDGRITAVTGLLEWD